MKECPKCRTCYEDSESRCPLDDKLLVASIIGSSVISGRYILEKRLGKGGMGIVFKAQHKFLKSAHAIKVILPNLVEDDESLLARFRQEAILAASIHHPNVVGVTDFGVEDENMPYLVMEFVDGVSLSSYLGQGTRLSPEKAYEIFLPIALGVGEAHRKGIVHRDLKPQNIMVQNGLPLKKAIKVLDFGLAKIKSTESLGSFVQAKTMSVLGSPPYMSPEQWSNGDVDHRADIYGLGVMLYEMLTGKLPFDGDSIPAIVYQHLSVAPPSFESHGVYLPPRTEAAIQQALSKERDDRPDSVEQLLAKIEESLVGTDAAATERLDSDSYRRYTADFERKNQSDEHYSSGLTMTQKEKLHDFFNIPSGEQIIADKKLAQDFLQAQDRAEEAKEQVSEADRLVHEFAEAQKLAEEAKQRAAQAQKRIEDDVRRRVEAEMKSKLAAEQQARQKAEAEARLLTEEAEARKKAEERANQLAQDALRAQQIAEEERRKAQQETHQRELEESVRRQAELDAQKLSEQVADAKKQYEEARQQAELEAYWRREAEAKREKIENQIIVIAESEAERRRLAEAEALKQVQEQAHRYENEALAAHHRVEEAKRLAEFEAAKREQAEAAQLRAEQEAQKLAQEIIEVQKRIQEIENSTSPNPRTGDLKTLNFLNPITDETLSDTISNDVYVSKTLPEIAVSDSFKSVADVSTNQQFAQFGEPTVSFQSQPQINQGGSDVPPYRTEPSIAPGFASLTAEPPRRPPILKIVAGVLGVFVILGGAIYFFSGAFKANGDLNAAQNQNGANSFGNSTQSEIRPEYKLGNRINDKMVLVAGGSFQMGRSDVPLEDMDYTNQYPAHPVSVKSFYLDKTEVSNDEYVLFVQAAKHPAPSNWKDGKPPAGEERFPVTFVSLTDAKAFAEWVGANEKKACRLPTEEEWEYAARNGSQTTSFPWGNEWKPGLANVVTGKVAAVGTSADETLVGGFRDMLGNVLEWTSTKTGIYPGNPKKFAEPKEPLFIVRGSSFGESQNRLKNAQWMITRRREIQIDDKNAYLGFRLACQDK